MDLIRDTASPYPMMLPTASQFARFMSHLRIRPEDILVIYDPLEPGFYSSPRVAWTCQYFGHHAVHILNTFPKYVQEGYPVSSGSVRECLTAPTAEHPAEMSYPERPVPDTNRVISFEELSKTLMDPSHTTTAGEVKLQILDSRPSGRFAGPVDTDLSVLPRGHIPSAVNVPFSSLLGPEKTVWSPRELADLLVKAGVKEGVPTVVYCNTGVTAAGLDIALQASGLTLETRLYDGSWSEWTKRADPKSMLASTGS